MRARGTPGPVFAETNRTRVPRSLATPRLVEESVTRLRRDAGVPRAVFEACSAKSPVGRHCYPPLRTGRDLPGPDCYRTCESPARVTRRQPSGHLPGDRAVSQLGPPFARAASPADTATAPSGGLFLARRRFRKHRPQGPTGSGPRPGAVVGAPPSRTIPQSQRLMKRPRGSGKTEYRPIGIYVKCCFNPPMVRSAEGASRTMRPGSGIGASSGG